MAATSKKEKRKAALGVSFEHGPNGAVMVYIGDEEVVLAFLPENYSVDSRAATALAVFYREQKEKKPLSMKTTKRILDRIFTTQSKPIVIEHHTLSQVIDMIKSREKIASVQKAGEKAVAAR